MNYLKNRIGFKLLAGIFLIVVALSAGITVTVSTLFKNTVLGMYADWGEGITTSLAIAIDGEVDPSSIMTVTVPLVSDTVGDNVGAAIMVSVPCICRCASVSVRNVSTQPVNVMNANIVFDFDGIRR